VTAAVSPELATASLLHAVEEDAVEVLPEAIPEIVTVAESIPEPVTATAAATAATGDFDDASFDAEISKLRGTLDLLNQFFPPKTEAAGVANEDHQNASAA
jgi:hypothetical protein